MQRDQKVGLALGVLLIGVVAAFFFRNETEPGRSAPALERAAEVDREIAEKRLTPYFSEIETDEPSRGTPARPAASQFDHHDRRTGERKLPRWDEAQSTSENDPFAADPLGNVVPAPAPDPIHYEGTSADNASRPPSDLQQAWKPADDDAQNADHASTHWHEVQRGETLSSIAGKHLGSQARFQEIFEANRDQLQDANDLKVGMKLRIPAAGAKPSAGKPISPPGQRLKKTPEPKSGRQISPDTADNAPPVDDVEAVTIGKSALEDDEPADPESQALGITDPPKIKFSPSKRRPAR